MLKKYKNEKNVGLSQCDATILYVLMCSNMSLHVLLLFSFIVWNDTMKMCRFGIHTLDFDRSAIEYK